MSGWEDMADEVMYPDIEVQLTGEDGNAMAIIGRVSEALRRGGVSRESIADFREQATRGSYEDLLNTVQRWVSVA